MIVYLLFCLLGVLVASVVGFELCLCLGVLVAFVVGFLYGRKSVSTVALQSQSANGKSKRNRKAISKATVQTQSQCTYSGIRDNSQPRFEPLPKWGHGAWNID